MILVDQNLWVHAWAVDAAPARLDGRLNRAGTLAHSLLPGRAAVLASRAALLVDVDRGAVELLTPCRDAAPQAVGLEESGAVVVGCNDQSMIRRVPGGQWTRIRVLDDDDGLPSLIQPLAGGQILVGTVSGTAMVLSPGGEVLARRRLGEDAVVTASTQGDLVVVGLSGGDLLAWDIVADVVTASFRGVGTLTAWVGERRLRVLGDAVEDRMAPAHAYPQGLRVGAGVSALAFAPDNAHIAVAAGEGLASVYRVADGRLRFRSAEGEDVVKDVAFDAAGGRLLVASAGLLQRVFRLGNNQATLLSRDEAWRRAAFAPDGSIIGAPYKPDYVRVVEGRAERREQPRGFSDLESLLGGTGLVGLGGEDVLYLSDDPEAQQWRELGRFPGAIGVAGGGRRVAVALDDRVSTIDVDGRATWSTPAPAGGTDLAVSADGQWVALGTIDGAVHVYRVGEAGPRATMRAHWARVAALAFSPDGHWLASGGWDEEVRLWSMAALTVDPDAAVREAEAAWGRDLDAILSAGPGVEAR
ncbi:MAG: hypothetical protein FJ102_07400 [Deltaproteobacteria bacterium]|nr:hypothetical protein [Deltaproteobacteria bacterium]